MSPKGQPTYRATNRDPMGVMMHPTGLGHSNSEGGDVFRDQAQAQNIDPKQFGITTTGDATTGRVVAHVVEPTTAGNTAVRQSTESKSVTIYLHDLFANTPGLRPETRCWCPIKPDVDAAGQPCIIIYLRGLDERRSTAKKAKAATEPRG